ncbi:Protein shuttle craft [Dufourea novaeangliae]|uniref:Protein shuttle craft n=1 Tax=Dufourea novaeangliae TaxID=178035 RepID=A0A154PBD9_DUFNO|nr:Protein shuttle craft [Dufourea novaeangliae]
MATWDGSYSEPDDQHYYVYSDQNVSGPAASNWTYFSNNVNNDYSRANREFCVQNDAAFQQNCPNTFYHSDTNVMPNVLSTSNGYQEHLTNPVDNSQMSTSIEYFPKNVKSQQCFLPAVDYRTNDYVLKTTKNKHNHTKEVTTNATKEFMEEAAATVDKYSMDNTNKYEQKRDNRRNLTYKPKEGQQDYFYKNNAYKHSYHQQGGSSYKFQDNKYYTKRRNTVAKYNNVQSNGTKQSIDQSKEYTYYNSGSKQSYAYHKNTRKYPYNIRHNRDEYNYREKRYNCQGQNETWENHSKEDKQLERREQLCSQKNYNEVRQGSSEEVQLGTKELKEKGYSYQGRDGHKERNKQDKIETFKERDRSKNNILDDKEKGNENWRNKRDISEKNGIQKRIQNKKSLVDDDASQRERLTEQLNRGQLECLVCCENIRQNDYIWSCSNCHHVLHLKCVKKWAKSSQADNGWRCPACQNVSSTIPDDYFCFCGKTKAPEWNRRDVAHSCGEVCGRTLSKNNCPHKCTLLCHPGSCPQCVAMVTRYCGCGKTSQTVQCSTHKLLLCESICDKDLLCGAHKCEKQCHHGECSNCEKTIEQKCYCGKNKREVICQNGVPREYSCETVCGKLLDCGNHICTKLCHPDVCEPCVLTPEKVTTCCCGQTLLTEERKTCSDPIPCCDKVCSKNLKCGQPNNPHTCKVKCHEGDCPICDLTTDVKCRCGNMDREIACKDLTSKADDARCEKRCTKRRSCGRHKCNQLCCIEVEHICPMMCSKTLSCGRHKCEQTCHKGRCQPCWRSSFDELYCECGAAVIYPPVPCGTRRPVCDRPCSRQHSCGHEVLHNCHSEPICPPCTVLTQRWCHGKHELRKAVACYVNEISCGLPCNKPISCGRHKCITICHPGSCEKPGQQCTQPCTISREMCGHICAAPCHDGKCPDVPCKEMVKVTCQCGHRMMSRVCAENTKEYQRIASSILASKMADMQLGHSINLEEVFGQGAKKQNQLKTLECNDECKLIERNRKLALGLQIVNPDLSGKLMPRYSDSMKQWAKKDPHFCQMVHEKLTELVHLAKTSKQKSRSYSFDCMKKDRRDFVHESCEHFGCESQAYDKEPKRNIVATAVKDKCWLPSYSLLEIVQRENGQRKVPGPMLNTSKVDGPDNIITAREKEPETQLNTKILEPEIDYFDYQG